MIDRASSTSNDIQVCSRFDAHVTRTCSLGDHSVTRGSAAALSNTRRDIAISPWILRSDWDTCARVWISKRALPTDFQWTRVSLVHEILPRFEIYRMDAATNMYNFPRRWIYKVTRCNVWNIGTNRYRSSINYFYSS